MDKNIQQIIQNIPKDWLQLTTHRLDIYDESQAKTEFLEELEKLMASQSLDIKSLSQLPTAYDYIRLGHPLSSILEWTLGQKNNLHHSQVISFDSQTMAILAVLRTNTLAGKNTTLFYKKALPKSWDSEVIAQVYNYDFKLQKIEHESEIKSTLGISIYIQHLDSLHENIIHPEVDFSIGLFEQLGSILFIKNKEYVSDIQHVRRRETIAMTPEHCFRALEALSNETKLTVLPAQREENKQKVLQQITQITESPVAAAVGSSGLSVQYAIMMGLVHDALAKHPNKPIRFLVPPNCYGGTNDQARRVAASIDSVEIVDMPVDAGNDMVQGIDHLLNQLAMEDAVPYIIAEIPTNPRVEVPHLIQLQEVLKKERFSTSGMKAVDPVFILDQTFCPNVHFLGKGRYLSEVRALSYASGSKFPSGGKCTAGYCVSNELAKSLMPKIQQHLLLCDNEATDLQYHFLAEQLPSMLKRIEGAYQNTRAFVNFIEETLPEAKINFVSEELAAQGFTPSVFSLDLPTQGNTETEREQYKRKLNHKLIQMMITHIADESKYCVSYGQLKGCYWTIPATSTQGTTQEGDKDYIARVALSANMDLEKHKEVFSQFVQTLKSQQA